MAEFECELELEKLLSQELLKSVAYRLPEVACIFLD